jgi:para-aminobenzoate synthetase/4-amino-4-deoxychorismate lyase
LNNQAINYFVLLDDMSKQQAIFLSDFHHHAHFAVSQLSELDNSLYQGWEQGLYSFVYIPYEFGVDLVKEPLTVDGTESITRPIHIFWFKQKKILSVEEVRSFLDTHSSTVAGIAEAQLSIAEKDYVKKIAAVHDAIRRGDVYQINFTSTLDFKSYGHPVALYRRLREQQQVPYAALANLPLDTLPWLLSFSPELFMDIQPDGVIRVKPMKGTAPILNDGQDEQRAIDLQNDPKNRAENLMIVDLLRNDLGRIAEIGQVKVQHLFEVERFGAVWQMTSTIEAKMPTNLQFSDVLKATFPCGSITGAPKKMSMQLIDELEQRERGIYTGSIGLIEKNDNGSDSAGTSWIGRLNVMIRSFHLRDAGEHYEASMGVGSGIVIDSKAAEEYEECFWKSRFVLGLMPEFSVFETMRWEDSRCALLERHKSRLLSTSRALAYPLSRAELDQALAYFFEKLPTTGAYRLKLSLSTISCPFEQLENSWFLELNQHLRMTLSLFSLEELGDEQRVLIKRGAVFSPTYLSRHKTDQRARYDEALFEALAYDAFDQLLFDANGLLLEGGRTNVFLKLENNWYTPSSKLPLLNGVMRQEIMANPERYLNTSEVFESELDIDDVLRAQEVILTNALRGLVSVKVFIV